VPANRQLTIRCTFHIYRYRDRCGSWDISRRPGGALKRTRGKELRSSKWKVRDHPARSQQKEQHNDHKQILVMCYVGFGPCHRSALPCNQYNGHWPDLGPSALAAFKPLGPLTPIPPLPVSPSTGPTKTSSSAQMEKSSRFNDHHLSITTGRC